jgi:hypothetical protein
MSAREKDKRFQAQEIFKKVQFPEAETHIFEEFFVFSFFI